MKMKTAELIGVHLDLAVAQAAGIVVTLGHNHTMTAMQVFDSDLLEMGVDSGAEFSPSTAWAQGGPIIERELLAPDPHLDSNCALIDWGCENWKGDGTRFYGATPLIAAMRCFVASKLGDEVNLPE